MLLDSPRANAVLQTESLDQHAAWSTPSPLGEARLVYRGLSDVPPPQNDLMLPRVVCEKKLERGVIVLQGVPSEPWSPPRSCEESGCLILLPITKTTVSLKMTPQQVFYECMPMNGFLGPLPVLGCGKDVMRGFRRLLRCEARYHMAQCSWAPA